MWLCPITRPQGPGADKSQKGRGGFGPQAHLIIKESSSGQLAVLINPHSYPGLVDARDPEPLGQKHTLTPALNQPSRSHPSLV